MTNLHAILESLPQGTLTRDHLLRPQTLLAQNGNLSAYYIPFGYYPPDARIALVGITPGFEQMRLAYHTARDNLHLEGPELYKACSGAAGFGGPMRTILENMLAGVGLEFTTAIKDSVLRHPVFVNGKNYTGHQPRLSGNDFLMGMVREYFGQAIAARPDALIVPMGRAVESTLRQLNLPNKILWGFPHPSPANGHRKKQYANNLESMRRQVKLWTVA